MIVYGLYFLSSAEKPSKMSFQTFRSWTIQFSTDGTLIVRGRRVFYVLKYLSHMEIERIRAGAVENHRF